MELSIKSIVMVDNVQLELALKLKIALNQTDIKGHRSKLAYILAL